MPSKPPALVRLAQCWQRYPLLFIALLVALLALPIWQKILTDSKRAAEPYYPLSHFPMYSDFTDWDYIVYLSDAQGKPLAMEKITGGLRVARMKKHYNSLLNQELDQLREQQGQAPSKQNAPLPLKRKVGDQTLQYLVDTWRENHRAGRTQTPPPTQPLQLHLVAITQHKGKVRPRPAQLIGSWSPSNQPN